MTAHLTFVGGEVRLPARTPYDRQQLIEHVRGCVRSRQQVRVRVDHATWLVDRAVTQPLLVCRGCARRISYAVCRRPTTVTAFCIDCALSRPHLTLKLLSELPAGAVLHDVEAHYAYGTERIAWTRWPQATPAEIIDDIHLQRRFAPVLTWRCAEIRIPQPAAADPSYIHTAKGAYPYAKAG